MSNSEDYDGFSKLIEKLARNVYVFLPIVSRWLIVSFKFVKYSLGDPRSEKVSSASTLMVIFVFLFSRALWLRKQKHWQI